MLHIYVAYRTADRTKKITAEKLEGFYRAFYFSVQTMHSIQGQHEIQFIYIYVSQRKSKVTYFNSFSYDLKCKLDNVRDGKTYERASNACVHFS